MTDIAERPAAARQSASARYRHGVRCTLRDARGTRTIRWSEVADFNWDEFGMVLGAGGSTGLSFEAGVLLALTVDHHVSLSNASHLVGTSAGSIVSTLITLGFGADDLAAVIAACPHLLSESAQPYYVEPTDEAPPPMPNPLSLVRRPSPKAFRQTLSHLAHARFRSLVLASMRQGTFDLRDRLSFLEQATWPAERPDLQIVVADVNTDERVVLDRTSDVPLLDAVAASCAVPMVMKPIVVGGRRFVDGGLHSPTNADLLGTDHTPDHVVVISPMSGDRAKTALGWTSAMRSTRRLQRELRTFSRAKSVLVIEPVGRLSELVVDRALDSEHALDIMTSAFLSPSSSRASRRLAS